MTREIKFRAWSNETKTMINWESIKELKNLQKLMSLYFVTLQQFTWLKDKNWVDIYEWDILKYKTNKNQYSDVEYMYDWFKIRSVRTSTTTVVSNLEYFLDKYACYVVWNIYENHDLIQTIK